MPPYTSQVISVTPKQLRTNPAYSPAKWDSNNSLECLLGVSTSLVGDRNQPIVTDQLPKYSLSGAPRSVRFAKVFWQPGNSQLWI